MPDPGRPLHDLVFVDSVKLWGSETESKMVVNKVWREGDMYKFGERI
jgi:hypothetical protein